MKKIRLNNQNGSSLIEVMVALLVMAIGLLGVLAMQTRAVQLNQNAYLYSQAAFLANDIVEAMQASGSSLLRYPTLFGDDADSIGATDCVVGACNADQVALWNVEQWKTNIESFLPNGEGEIIAVDDNTGFLVKVRFRTAEDIGTGNEEDLPTITLRTGF